jgi:hypothetical protein
VQMSGGAVMADIITAAPAHSRPGTRSLRCAR